MSILTQVSSSFLACGLIRLPAPPTLTEKIHKLGTTLQIVPLKDYGYFFFTAPPYADLAENDDGLVIKLGQVRASDELTSASTTLDRGLVTPFNVQHNDIHGNALLICFNKHEPLLCAYKSPLSIPQLYFWTGEGCTLFTNNLGLMTQLLDDPQLNPEALPLHFLFRSVPGRQTYLKDVYRLGSGEVLNWRKEILSIDLRRSLRAFSEGNGYEPVEPESVNRFYEQLREMIGVYLKGLSVDGHRSATLLSGGIDSSLLQMAVKAHFTLRPNPLSFSYTSDAPSFAPEIENAKAASRFLGSEHSFIHVSTTDYPDLLVAAIEALGQPPHHEQTPYYIAVARYASANQEGVRYLLGGEGADALHGMEIGRDIYRAEKYLHWPQPLLRLLGTVLDPVWQSKAYGARRAADVIPHLNDYDSIWHPMNVMSVYTDWEILPRCFDIQVIREALAYRRELEKQQFDSSSLIERVHALHLLTDTCDSIALWQQLGLAYGQEIVYPYLDDAVVTMSMAFDPQRRFFLSNRTKPVLKLILEQKGADAIVNKPKYGGGWGNDLPDWMRQGVLRDMVQAIQRPAFMERADFQRKIEHPDWFTWNLLTMDLFNKHVLAHSR
jgi:asparagine synthetase B (glutamine-hydrolysing)